MLRVEPRSADSRSSAGLASVSSAVVGSAHGPDEAKPRHLASEVLTLAIRASAPAGVNSLGLPPAVEFIVTEHGSVRSVIELRLHRGRSTRKPRPSTSAYGVPGALIPAVAAGLGMGIAASAMHERRLRGAPVSAVRILLPAAVPDALADVGLLYGTLTGTPIYLEPRGAPPVEVPTGRSLLLSGGKDTLWMLLHASEQGSIRGTPAVYLMGGAEINWRAEAERVKAYQDYFEVDVRSYELTLMSASSATILPYASRATWRELVTIALARGYGDEIHTGVNLDDIARMSPEFVTAVTRADVALYLSQLAPTLSLLEKGLGARILTVPGEFQTYRETRGHPLFSVAGSCMTPTCRNGKPCGKCRGFRVYETLLAGEQLSDEQLGFVLGPKFLGDSSVVRVARAYR